MFQQVKDLALSTAVVQVVAVVWVRSPAQEFLHAVGEVKKKKKKILTDFLFCFGGFLGLFFGEGVLSQLHLGHACSRTSSQIHATAVTMLDP